ncbi:MAG: hypothetical protein V3V67_17485 [Myxococcota bacterium]
MLDHHLEGDPVHWPVVRQRVSLEEIRAVREYARIRRRLPRGRLVAEEVERKSLVHTPTGKRYSGAIYRLRRRGGAR